METLSSPYQRPAWASVCLIVLVILIGFLVIGPLIGILIAMPFIDGGLLTFIAKLSHPGGHTEIKTPLLILQSCVTFFGLAVCPALYWWIYEKENPFNFLKNAGVPAVIILLTAMIVLSFIPVDTIFIDWNAHVVFPDFLKDFESWAKKNEANDEEMIKLFTSFDSIGQFIFAFIAIAVIAGFSEELVFRGMLQPQMLRATGNIHVAIWLTAILFSALHLQFFGFVPRVLLGALFGYLYYWSGNLLIPMIAHTVNNGLSVIGLYLYQQKKIDINPEENTAAPWGVVIVALILLAALLFYFQRYYKQHAVSIITDDRKI